MRKIGLIFITFLILHLTNIELNSKIKNDQKIHGSWFGKKTETNVGFYIREIYIPKHDVEKSFSLVQLSYNKYKNWEETRYKGTYQINENNEIILSPNFCSIYTVGELGNRWSLYRGFDCAHLNFVLKKPEGTNNQYICSPSMNLKKEENYTFIPNFKKNQYTATIIDKKENDIKIWGIDLYKIKKKHNAFLFRDGKLLGKVNFLLGRETSGKLEKKDLDFAVSDFVIFENLSSELY